jgi:hypothetical protein
MGKIAKNIVAAGAAAAAFLIVSSTAEAASRGVLSLSNGKRLDYYSNTSLTSKNPKLTHAVIVVHGSDRNADDYAYRAEKALKQTSYGSQTIIVAPQFGESARRGYLHWPESGDTYMTDWAYGGADKAAKFPSFQVIDELVVKLLDRSKFPNIKLITVTGHSAGGQFVQRYSIGTNMQNLPGARMRFVPMNPSSYMYLTDKRLVKTSWTEPSSCSGYNRYRYGLERLNDYMSDMPSNAASRYASRPTRLLSGTADTATDSGVDTTCQAKLQGSNRRDRAVTYDKLMDKFWPSNNFQRVDVSGVGHSSSKMMSSSVGRNIIFGQGW